MQADVASMAAGHDQLMRFFRNSLVTMGGIIGPVIIGLAITPFLLDAIGPARYGALAISWLFLGYFGQADFGIGRATTRRIAQLAEASTQERARVVWSAFLTILIFGVALGGIAYGASILFFGDVFKAGEGIREELMQSLVLIALCGPVVATFGVAVGCLQGGERFSISATANFISNVGFMLCPLIVALFYTDHMQALIGASLGGRALGLVVALGGAWFHFLRHNRVEIDRRELIGLLQTGKWIMVTALVGPLMIIADRFVIGAQLGAIAVAAYTIPFQAASRMLLFPLAVSQVMFPKLAAMKHEEAETAHRGFVVLVGNLFLPLIVVLICLAEPLLRLWIGSNLDPRSVLVAQIILAGIWVNGLAHVPYSYLQARNRARFVALLHMSELPIYAALLFGLAAAFGLPGIAAAFAIRCTIDLVGLLIGSRVGLLGLAKQLLVPVPLIAIPLALHDWLTGWSNPIIAALVFGGLAGAYTLLSVPAEFWQDLLARLRKRGANAEQS